MSLISTSCFKRYDPLIEGDDAVKFVVSGQISKGDSIHRIHISTTSLISKIPKFFPVADCYVVIQCSNGNTYIADNQYNGDYDVFIPDNEIEVGYSYLIKIRTSNDELIVSDYDQLQECPEVDSVYYKLEQLPSENPYLAIRGIRFYFDLDAHKVPCRLYRWEAIETWKYVANLALDPKLKVCWMTSNIKNIYTLSNKNLSENRYQAFPLHFVDNFSSQRLAFGYSLLIRQFSLSEEAFKYWDNVRINNSEQGGLYAKQPLPIKGNLHNISNPNKIVLGYFGASSVTSKRIFVENVPGLPNLYLYCEPDKKPDEYCINCLASGGTNIKPSFWPK